MLNIQALSKEYIILREAGFEENASQAIAFRSLFPGYKSIVSDALDIGHHHFDLKAYDLRVNINRPENQVELFNEEEESKNDGSPRAGYYPFLSVTKKIVMGAGIAATMLCTLGVPAFGQDTPQDNTLHFEEKAIDYTLNGNHYSLKIMEVSASESTAVDKITTVDEAIACIKRDDIAAVLLAGDFTDKEIDNIREAIGKLYRLNSRLISDLEPTIVKLPNCGESLASNNRFEGAAGLKEYLEKYGCGKSAEEIRGYTDYTEVADKLLSDITQFIPTSEENFQRILKNIEETQRKERGFDKLDGILSGINDEDMVRTIIHEFGHLVSYEGIKGYKLFTEMKKHQFLSDGRLIGSINYIRRRDAEVRHSVEKKKKLLEVFIDNHDKEQSAVISVLEKMFPAVQLNEKYKEINDKLGEALKNLGREKLMDRYEKLLEAEVVEWRHAERIAEDIVEVAVNGKAEEAEVLSNTKTLELIATIMERQGSGCVESDPPEGYQEKEFGMVKRFLKEFGR